MFYSKCSNIPVRLVEDPDFRCGRYLINEWSIDGIPCVEYQFIDGKLDAVDRCDYLDDCVCPGEGCRLATIN